MPTFPAPALRNLCERVLLTVNVPDADAKTVAESLVTANLMGHDSHGVIRVMQYVDQMKAGDIVPGAAAEVVRETPSAIMVDGHWNFGQVTARWAMEKAIEKVAEHGSLQVTVRNTNHVGRLGEYGQMAAERGLVALLVANGAGAGNVAPFGGRSVRLATNPISFAAPWDGKRILLLDTTTSVVAEGKVRVKFNRGEKLPEPWILDAAGRLSTDPKDLYGPPKGSLLPLGGSMGHKGFGLSLMVEILGGILSGAGAAKPNQRRGKNGVYGFVIDPDRFLPRSDFMAQVGDLIDYVKSSERMPGVEEILVPGEPEFRTLAERRQKGIPLDDETWRQLSGVAEQCRVPVPP